MSWKKTAILILASIIFLIQVYYYWDYSIDDAYITFTYAENLADGYGPVFNPEDNPIEAYSNALWMFLLSFLYSLGIPTVAIAKLLGVFFFLLTGWFWAWLFRNHKLKTVWLAGPLFLICPLIPFWAVSGLELGLYSLSLVGAFAGLLKRKWWASVFLAMLVWGRPEGFIIAGFLVVGSAAVDIYHSKLEFKRYLLYLLGIILAIAAITEIRLTFFGLPLPNTFYVKTGTINFNFSAVSDSIIRFSPILILMIIGLIYDIKGKLSNSGIILAISVFVVQLVISTLVDPVMNFLFRYMAAFVILMIFGALFGLSIVKPVIVKTIAIVLIAISLISPITEVLYRLDVEAEILSSQRGVIDWANKLDGRKTISMTDIGRIPYYTNHRYIDIWGLASENIREKGFNSVDEFLKFPDYFIFVGYLASDSRVELRFGRERLIARIGDMPKVYPLVGYVHSENVPIDSFGYHYLIFEKDPIALDSILQKYINEMQ